MALSLAAGVWALSVGASSAHAGGVNWSVGVYAPGVVVGASNAQPHDGYETHRRPGRVHGAPVVVYPGYGQVRPVVIAPSYGGHYRGDRNDWEDRRDWRHERRIERREHRRAEQHNRRNDRGDHGYR